MHNFFVDGDWKSERNWSGSGLVASEGDGTMMTSLSTSCFSSSLLPIELRVIYFAVLLNGSCCIVILMLYTKVGIEKFDNDKFALVKLR